VILFPNASVQRRWLRLFPLPPLLHGQAVTIGPYLPPLLIATFCFFHFACCNSPVISIFPSVFVLRDPLPPCRNCSPDPFRAMVDEKDVFWLPIGSTGLPFLTLPLSYIGVLTTPSFRPALRAIPFLSHTLGILTFFLCSRRR